MPHVVTRPHIDFAARTARLRTALNEQRLDAGVVMAPANIAYLSGFQALLYSRPIYLIVDAGRTELVVPGLEEEHATHATGIDAVHVYYEHPEKGKAGENAPDMLAARLKAIGAGRVGLEYGSAPIALREHLETRGLTSGNLTPAIVKMRLIKDD